MALVGIPAPQTASCATSLRSFPGVYNDIYPPVNGSLLACRVRDGSTWLVTPGQEDRKIEWLNDLMSVEVPFAFDGTEIVIADEKGLRSGTVEGENKRFKHIQTQSKITALLITNGPLYIGTFGGKRWSVDYQNPQEMTPHPMEGGDGIPSVLKFFEFQNTLYTVTRERCHPALLPVSVDPTSIYVSPDQRLIFVSRASDPEKLCFYHAQSDGVLHEVAEGAKLPLSFSSVVKVFKNTVTIAPLIPSNTERTFTFECSVRHVQVDTQKLWVYLTSGEWEFVKFDEE